MAKVSVIKGVPVPKGGAGRPRKYPFPDLDVGDSFLAEASYQTMHSCAKKFAAHFNGERAFRIKKISETHCQVWRIK